MGPGPPDAVGELQRLGHTRVRHLGWVSIAQWYPQTSHPILYFDQAQRVELGGSLQTQSYPYIPETDLVMEKTPPSSHMPEFPGSQGRKGLHPKGEVLLEHLRNCP